MPENAIPNLKVMCWSEACADGSLDERYVRDAPRVPYLRAVFSPSLSYAEAGPLFTAGSPCQHCIQRSHQTAAYRPDVAPTACVENAGAALWAGVLSHLVLNHLLGIGRRLRPGRTWQY